MSRTQIVLVNGLRLETEISKDDLFVLYKSVAQKRVLSPIILEVFYQGKRVGVDIRKIDSDATFTPPVSYTEPVAA